MTATVEQGSLFADAPLWVRSSPHQSLEEKWWAFHVANPHVYATLVMLARQAVAAGQRRLGMKALWERMRWELMITVSTSQPKLNNNWTSRYARLIQEREPDLAGLFETRRLRS